MQRIPAQVKRNFLFLGIALVLVLLLHVGIGSYLWLSPFEVLREIFRGPTSADNLNNHVLWTIRLPRALGCVMVGGLLASVGSAFQALFRNPLVDPYIVGVSSGAGIGGALALVLGLDVAFFHLGLLLFSFLGGLLSLALVVRLATRKGAIQIQNLLIAGVVVGSMLASLLTLVLLFAGKDTNVVMRWLLGSSTPMEFSKVSVMAITLVAGGIVLFRQTRILNAFASGEETAQRLGVDTGRLRTTVLVVGTAMSAVAVGSVGIIGFLGLVAPHISRRLLGVDLRVSFLGAMMIGPALLLAADAIAQRAMPFGELPVGAVTALLGAPALLALLRRD